MIAHRLNLVPQRLAVLTVGDFRLHARPHKTWAYLFNVVCYNYFHVPICYNFPVITSGYSLPTDGQGFIHLTNLDKNPQYTK
jgi:hypothetical protein